MKGKVEGEREATGTSLPSTPAPMLIARAFWLARAAHDGQVDLSGARYFDHVIRVARKAAKHGPKAAIVALLHDVLEDTAITKDDVRREFGEDVTLSVLRLTHVKGMRYRTYITGIKEDETARIVKIADIEDHLETPIADTKISRERKAKYMKALKSLIMIKVEGESA